MLIYCHLISSIERIRLPMRRSRRWSSLSSDCALRGWHRASAPPQSSSSDRQLFNLATGILIRFFRKVLCGMEYISAKCLINHDHNNESPENEGTACYRFAAVL